MVVGVGMVGMGAMARVVTAMLIPKTPPKHKARAIHRVSQTPAVNPITTRRNLCST